MNETSGQLSMYQDFQTAQGSARLGAEVAPAPST